MDDRVLALIISRLDKLEEKVDKLISFRAWLLGIGAAAGALASIALNWATGKN